MTEREERDKIIDYLEWAIGEEDVYDCLYVNDLEGVFETLKGALSLIKALDVTPEELERLKAQSEVIDDLLKVGYPHNFQREEPWIVNYMYAITNVIKKAVNLSNGQ